MPAPRTLTVPEGAKEVEIPKEYLHQDDLGATHVTKQFFETEIASRLASATAGRFRPEELLEKDEFLKTAAEKKKDHLLKLLNVKPTGQEVDLAKAVQETVEKVRREELVPLQTTLSTREEEIRMLRLRALDAQVAEAGVALNIEPELLDLVKLHVRGLVEWDENKGEWFVKRMNGEKGFEPSLSTKPGGHPYMGVAEALEKLKRGGERKSWFRTGAQPGAGYAGGAGGEGAVSLEGFAKMSPSEQTAFFHAHPQEYYEFMRQIREAGEAKLFAGAAPFALPTAGAK